MKIVIAPDSFKGSLTSIEVTNIIETAIFAVNPNYSVIKKPMADGGEGTIDALLSTTKGERINLKCTGPLGETVETYYAIVGNTAIIECANIAGLTQVPPSKRNPDVTTTYGIGEAILDALDKGCQSFIIGLGGSATNDGGLGMLIALGMRAYDDRDERVGIFGKDLLNVRRVDLANLDPRLQHIQIQVASDVHNPLCGERGASAVYGPQKGATPEQIQSYDNALRRFATLVESHIDRQVQHIPGAGAAGGLGFALLALGAEIDSGAALIATKMHIEQAIKQADLVITGEGQSDEQTLYGKAPGYIATLANKYKVPAILISGSIYDVEKLQKVFAGCFAIPNRPLTLAESMKEAESLLYLQAKQVINLVSTVIESGSIPNEKRE